jgi:hypothetical protein
VSPVSSLSLSSNLPSSRFSLFLSLSRLGCKSLMALEVAKQGQPGGGALITQDGQGLSITDAVVEHPAAAAQTPLEVQQMQPLAWPGAYIVAFWHWPRHS